jgi:ectoine hydroxylase-related dioxygenase (phytanoyl-CoA dioxygenase family)
MRKVFNENELEEKFQKEGYLHISFLDKEQVDFLLKEFHRLIVESGGSIVSGETDIPFEGEITYDFTFIDRNPEYKRKVLEAIDTVFKPIYDKILFRYKPIIANYIRKKTDKGEVPLHQNWAFIDERKCTSVSIWVPLIDSNRGNGALEVVPRSHKRFGEVRGPMVPWELEGIKQEIIENDLVTCSIKAGDAIILDDSIVHYSFSNKTNDLRIAIQLILIPEEEPSIHYHLDPSVSKESVEVLEVDREFYTQFNPWKKPEGMKKIKTLKFHFRPFTHKDFHKALKQPRFDEKTNFFQKIKTIFS